VVREDDDEDEDATVETETQKAYIQPPDHKKDDLANNWEALNAKLTYESMQQKELDKVKSHEVSIGEYTGGDDQLDHEDNKKRAAPTGSSPEDAKKKSFADKRAAHYNEVSASWHSWQQPVEQSLRAESQHPSTHILTFLNYVLAS
jgi:hypothetical protein